MFVFPGSLQMKAAAETAYLRVVLAVGILHFGVVGWADECVCPSKAARAFLPTA